MMRSRSFTGRLPDCERGAAVSDRPSDRPTDRSIDRSVTEAILNYLLHAEGCDLSLSTHLLLIHLMNTPIRQRFP